MFRAIKSVLLLVATRLAAAGTTLGTAIDVSGYSGEARLVLNASAVGGADNTLDVKLVHCDTVGGAYVDSGFAFTQVNTASGASYQVVGVNVDRFKKFVKVSSTFAGVTTPSVTYGVELIAKADQA